MQEKKKDDTISRQAAIEALTENKEMINAALDSLTLDFNKRRNQEQRRGQINEDIETIKDLPSAQPEQRWIPCEEQLPEENGHYIVTVHPDYLVPYSLGVDVLIWHDKKWQYLDVDEFADFPDPIVAWKPLPEPYWEEGEADG